MSGEDLRSVIGHRPLAKDINVPWDDRATGRALAGLRARRARRVRLKITMASAAACALLLLVWAWQAARETPSALVSAERPTAPAPSEETATLSDGSRARPLDEDTVLQVGEDGPTRQVLRLVAGRGRFEVVKNPGRRFRVEAGAVSVEALGTRFDVARVAGDRVHVEVSEGRVRVAWPTGSDEVGAGEQGLYPPEVPADVPATRSMPRKARAARPEQSQTPAWVALARQRRFDESFRTMAEANVAELSPEQLMLAADVARLSGHPRRAAPYLERMLRVHEHDPRAPLAAFSLGRLLLHMLDRPAEAAERFAQARTLAPLSTLAEDALAREVEAWTRAGDRARARVRANEYLRLHPGGQWATAVRRQAGR